MSITPQTQITNTPTATPQVPGRRRGLRLWAMSIIAAAAVALGLFGGTAASASVPVAGVTFTSDVNCSSGAEQLEVLSGSNFQANSLAMIYLYDYRTGLWIHETTWHNVSGYGLLLHDAFNFVGHGYYRVYMYYAQYTTTGWKYNGEYINTYHQRNANGYGSYVSGSCYI